MSTIHGLKVENFKRIKVVDLKPSPTGPVIVSGKNAQGKTSLFDALMVGIAGPKAQRGIKMDQLIREGEKQAKISIDLGDMTVDRIIRNGTQAVVVRTKDGELKSPQSALDTFFSRYTFDPLAFLSLPRKDQREMLVKLVDIGIDVDQVDANRATLYAKRTDVGREKTALGDMPEINAGLPLEETSAGELIARVQKSQEIAALNDADRHKLLGLQTQLATNSNLIEELRGRLVAAEAARKQIEVEIEAQVSVVEALTMPEDIAELQVALAGVESTNASIRANNAARELSEKIAALAEEYDNLSVHIKDIDEVKAAALKKAVFPVDGLGFSEDGITFNDRPFELASSAEQIRVSMGIAISANPTLKIVRIMDGSLLDNDGLQIVSDLASDNGYQVWIEMVDRGEGVGFVISDGELVDAEASDDLA